MHVAKSFEDKPLAFEVDDIEDNELTISHKIINDPNKNDLLQSDLSTTEESHVAKISRILESIPLEEARMELFAELARFVETELLDHSSIEWEERIHFHTVMVKNLSIEKKLLGRDI